jgi:hypothetical protein
MRNVTGAVAEGEEFFDRVDAGRYDRAGTRAGVPILAAKDEATVSASEMLLAGSIGLDTVTARLNMADAINDLQIVSLGAFAEGTADALLKTLAASYGIELTETVRRHAIARAGWAAPYYLQLIFHGLRDTKGTISTTVVDRVIDDLLGPRHKN